MEIELTGNVTPEIDEELMARWRPKLGNRGEKVYRELHRLIVAGRTSVNDAALANVAGCGKTILVGEVLPALQELGVLGLSDDN